MGVVPSWRHNDVQETSVNVDDVQQEGEIQAQKGMILPFEPLSLTFHNVCYYVDMPKVSVFWLNHIECRAYECIVDAWDYISYMLLEYQ